MWKPLKNYNGFYEISSEGRVRSVDRTITRSDGVNLFCKGIELKPTIDKYGYVRFSVSINKKKETLKMHREVAKVFIPNPEKKEQVNHINGIKHDNKVENLEWMTNQENQIHAIETGLKIAKTGKEAARYKRETKVLDMDGNYLYSLHGNKEMKEHGFDYRLVNAVIQGKRKSHAGHKFKTGEII